VINLVFIIHSNLSLALVTLYRMKFFIWVFRHHFLFPFPPFPLILQRKPELLISNNRAVEDEHSSVLLVVDLVPLTVQAHRREAGRAVEHSVAVGQRLQVTSYCFSGNL